MLGGQRPGLPKTQLQTFTDGLQLQAAVDGVAVAITSKNNGNGTVDVSWTVTPKPRAAPTAPSSTGAPPPVAPAPLAEVREQLAAAAAKIGVDQALLAGIAYAESSLDATEQSQSSSAYGLFQFIDGTWKDVVGQYGAGLGVKVTDRSDIRAQCLMGAAFLRGNQTFLQQDLGRAPMDAECYAAHFFGVGTAAKLLTGDRARSAEDALGADAPKIISANPEIFRNGPAIRTVGQVLDVLGSIISRAVAAAAKLLGATPHVIPNASAPSQTSLFGVGDDVLSPAMVAAIQHRLQTLNDRTQASGTTLSTAERVYNAARACETVMICAFRDLDKGNLACAFAVNRVVQFATGHPVDGSVSTDGLYASLSKKANKTADPRPGTIVISPTQGDVHGHVGIVGSERSIYSNSSDLATRGVFLQDYDLTTWDAELVKRRGLETFYFDLP
jgi:hypothetical protein